MNMHSKRRKGIALAVALVAIVVIGALIAGAFFASTQEYRIGRNSLIQESAQAASEHGSPVFLSQWNNQWASASMKDGQVITRYDSSNGVVSVVRMTRLNQNTFWIVSTGVTGTEGGNQTASRRRTGLILRIWRPNVRVNGAITTANTTQAAGSGSVNGVDANPDGWTDCDETGDAKAGIVNDNSADVTSAGTCKDFTCVSGSPKVLQDASAGDPNTYTNYEGATWDSLTASATYTINVPSGGITYDQMKPSYNADGSCKRIGDTKNWGDRLRNATTPGKCEDFFPIVYFKGTGLVTLSQGTGQGTILIEGNAKIAGNFNYTGLIIVKGTTVVEGVGNKIWGGLMAMNQGCTTNPCNTIKGDAHIQYSRCAINAAFQTKIKPVVSTRAWADMF